MQNAFKIKRESPARVRYIDKRFCANLMKDCVLRSMCPAVTASGIGTQAGSNPRIFKSSF